ncbi:TPA: DUF4320 family protein [Clostridioides difficile]|nr:DUF4320 family protein [Clostridioides difficile]MCI4304718.1 DUF4320 family protein [Clostridioides difficile]MCM4101615.1 DUF4320 family protein [Clostridioides difficile]
MKNLLEDERGFIDSTMGVIAIAIVASLFISLGFVIFPALDTQVQLNNFAKEIVREAQITGEIDKDVDKKMKNLEDNLVKPDKVIWDAKYITGTKKIQLNEEIKVRVEKTVDLGFFDFGHFPVPLHGSHSGRSEVYWRD